MTDSLIISARSKLAPELIDFVIYHSPCHDGFTAAWCAWRFNDKITFHPTRHNDPAPNVTGKNVLIVDFSYKKEILLDINEKANNLIVLDHHISAQKDLEDLDFAFFDMKRSGAGMAWDYFFNEKRPELINFVEDRDIWRWSHAGSAEFMTAFMELVPKKFEEYNRFLDQENINDMIEKGRVINIYVQNKVKRLITKSANTTFLSYNIKFVNTMDHISDIGNLLSIDCDFALMWYHDAPNNCFPISLRSNGLIDVSAIAKLFGGGGHKAAAGFVLYTSVLEFIEKHS